MATIEVNYFNTFMLNKLVDNNGDPSFPAWLGGSPVVSGNNWYVEESRIRGGYNNVENGYGVKAYIVEDQKASQNLTSNIIYSGVYNSRTGFNETNQFSVGKDITKAVDPANGSIQKLYAEDTNLIVFQEDKVSRALIDKDAIYSAEGGGSITSSKTVIGQIVPYAGEFGISTNPESFAVYGYRKYFTDIRRNAILRLSMDGLTEISSYGMKDYFRDEFNKPVIAGGKILGSFDINNKSYVTSIQGTDNTYSTLYFDDSVNGWVSFLSFKPTLMGSLRNKFYSFYEGKIWEHYSNVPGTRGNFYGLGVKNSSIEFIFNAKVSMPKVFQNVNYEGSNGWKITNMQSDPTDFDVSPVSPNPYKEFSDIAAPIYSYEEGAYVEDNIQYRAGFNRRENKYFANIINSTPARSGEVVYGDSMTGIKGFFTTVTVSTDYAYNESGDLISGTNPGGLKELFAVSTNYVESSY